MPLDVVTLTVRPWANVLQLGRFDVFIEAAQAFQTS